jgi:hypothetical protein
MSVTHIVAKDNIGLSVINESSKMLFDIPSTHKNDKDKILKLCINQIIEDFNPSEPYLFYNKDNIIKSIALKIDSTNDNTLTIQINSTKHNIYKLKIVGIITEPIYYLCTSHEIFNDIYEKIKSKYTKCIDGIFTFDSNEIDLDTPLDKLKFKIGCGKINEIIFEINTKYKKLFDSYKIIDKCDDYTIQLCDWLDDKSVFIQQDSYLYCFKYNLLKKFLDNKLINDMDLDEINLTPHLEITTSINSQCKDKYKKYNNMKINKINIEYKTNYIFFNIDGHVHYILLLKKELNTNWDKYKKIIDEELKIFQIIETKKKIKEKIPTAVRNTLWTNYFGKTLEGKCQCCKKETISKNNFDCGHVISEKNGGTVDLDNLRPICRSCNSSMGIRNMDDFLTEYKFNSNKSKKVESENLEKEFICGIGCGKVLKSYTTLVRHNKYHCKILKQQKINNIELEKMKDNEIEKMKIEIKLLKKNFKKEITSNKNEIKLLTTNVKEHIEYKEKNIEENEILKNKNKKLKSEIEKLKSVIKKIDSELELSSSQDETPQNKKIIKKKEVYESSDYESSTDEDKKPKNKKIIKKKEVYESSDYESSTDEDEKPKKIIKKK